MQYQNQNYSQMNNQNYGNMSQASGQQFHQNNLSAPNAQMNSSGIINPAQGQNNFVPGQGNMMGGAPSSNVSQNTQPQLSQQEVQQINNTNSKILKDNVVITKLAQWMKKKSAAQRTFSQFLNLAIDHTIVICDMAQFINLMISRDKVNGIGLKREEAKQLVENFIYTKKDVREAVLVNISAIQDAIAKCGIFKPDEQASMKKMEDFQYDAMKAKEIIFKTVSNYAMTKGLTPEQFFTASDKGIKKVLSPDELLISLKAAGANIQMADINPAFDSKLNLEYSDFQKILAGFQYERIDDCSHWAFHIFEDLRRKTEGPGNSLCEKFGVPINLEVKLIPWSVFKTSLKKTLNIQISPQEEQKLQDLFQINTAGANVPLDLLMRYRGLDSCYEEGFHTQQKIFLGKNRPVSAVPSGSSSATQKASNVKGVTKEKAPDQNMLDKAQKEAFLERKRAVKKLLLQIQMANISADELFSSMNIGNATTMTKEEFFELLAPFLTTKNAIDLTVQKQLQQFYFSSENKQISVRDLKNSLSSYLAMQKVIFMIFGRAEIYCQMENVANIGALFQKMMNRPNIKEFTLPQLSDFTKKLGLQVKENEAAMLGYEYDPGQTAASVNFEIFENDYKEWVQERASKVSWKQASFNMIDRNNQNQYKTLTPRIEKESPPTSATIQQQQQQQMMGANQNQMANPQMQQQQLMGNQNNQMQQQIPAQQNQFQIQPQMTQQQPMGATGPNVGKQYQIDPRTGQPIQGQNGMLMLKVINPQNGQQYADQHGHMICQFENPMNGQVELNQQGQQVFYMFNNMTGTVNINPQTGQMEISNFDPRTGGIYNNMIPTQPQPNAFNQNLNQNQQPVMAAGPDKETQELIVQVKKWIKNKGVGGKLAIELAKRNNLGTGEFGDLDYKAALDAVGAKVSSKQVTSILSAIMPTKPGGQLYPADRFFSLLADQNEAYGFYQAVMNGPQIAIQNTTTSGSQQPNINKNVSALMGQIGFKVESVKNYEQIFINSCAPGSNKVNPALTEQEMLYALKELSINLNSKEERNELSDFFRQNKTEDGKVYLMQLFKALGIETKATGKDAAKEHMTKKFLKDDELKDCAKKLLMLSKEYSKSKRKPDIIFDGPLTPKETGKNNEGQHITIKTFKNVLENDLGADFVRKSFGPSTLNNIQLYLEEDDGLISIAKYKQAIVRKEGQEPLTQHCADERNAYKQKLTKDLGKVGEAKGTNVQDFVAYLRTNNIEIKELLGPNALPDQYPVATFKVKLEQHQKPYKLLSTIEQLVQDIDPKADLSKTKKKPTFSLPALKKVMIQGKAKKSTPELIKAKLAKQDVRVKDFLDKILIFMKKQGLTAKQLHAELDIDKDGAVTKTEFTSRLAAHGVDSLGIKLNELGIVFDALDTSADGELSLQEFNLYLGVVKESRKERQENLDETIKAQLREEVHAMFSHFDIDGNGKVDAGEIYQTLQSLGQKRSLDQCEDMIKHAGASDEGIDRNQFDKLMYPIMLDDYISFEENVDDLKRVFLEADVDYSGKLSVDELYFALKNNNMEISKAECVELMLEVDIDQCGGLDIDEFLSIFGSGNQMHFANQRNQQTFDKIQQQRKGRPMDFLKIFKNMPNNFVPSFIGERWDIKGKNLPSSVFSAKVDPKTMLWKDVRPILSEDLQGTPFGKAGHKPFTRLVESQIGAQISMVQATGVPLPKVGEKSSFKDEHIVKRVIRVAVEKYCGNEMAGHWELVGNAIQIPAIWKKTAEDVWEFEKTNKSLRNILMRTTKPDGLEESEVGDPARIIFELVVYCQTGEASDDTQNMNLMKRIKELCCGWCKVNVDQLKKKQTLKLEIQGGSPYQEMKIKKDDVRDNRQGLAFMSKQMFGVEQKLEIDILPLQNLDQDVKLHLELMPSTCFMHKTLLYFISGFINYKSDKLLSETEGAGVFRKPTGDHIISSFPMIYDNPDIVEEMATLWFEDIQPQIDRQGKYNIKFIMEKTCDYIARLYPILYSDEFKDINRIDSTKSAMGSKKLLERRQQLIKSSLRYKQKDAKVQEAKPISEMSTYRPFNIKELNFEVWDTTASKKDNFLRCHGNRGYDDQYADPHGMQDDYELEQINSSKRVSFAQQ